MQRVTQPLSDVARGPGALVGRRHELCVLDAHLERAMLGHGALVVVQGAAGIGKTRLCAEVAERAVRRGVAVAWGRCWVGGGAPPLWPWQQVLPRLCDERTAKLLDGDAGSSTVDPERFARFTAVTDRLDQALHDRPACVILDDAHLADPGALLLTRFIARTLFAHGLLVVVSRRIELEAARPPIAELLDELANEGDVVLLHHLERPEVVELLRQRGFEDLDPTLVDAIQRLTGGNPLFLQRLAALGPPGPTDELPRGLRAAIADAVDRLVPQARDQLRISAVLGSVPSIKEAAELAEVDPTTLLDTVNAAHCLGLVGRVGPSRFSFSHDLVREVLVNALPSATLLDVHARAVEVVGRSANEPIASRLARRAHHAIRAAARSPDDAVRAVAAAREAARAMTAGFAYEQAAELLHTAARIHADAGLDGGAALDVDEAQAVLLTGRLAEARALFDRAATSAAHEGASTLLAEAALGLGGVWVNEHRTAIEWRRVRALQRRALDGLPSDEDVLACRLRTRLAADAVYVGGSVAKVLDTLADARRTGDPNAVAEALSLTHHVLLTPEHTNDRLPLADELVAVASAAGLGVLALMGLCWRTVDLFQLGDPSAERVLAELRERSDAVGCRSVRYIVAVLDVMLAIRAGRLEEAESAAVACYALGNEVGDADAMAYVGAHLVTIRWLQGRDAEALELVERVAASPSLVDAEMTYPALEAVFAARTGDVDRARAALGRTTASGLAAIHRSSTWLSAMLAVVEAAAAVGDCELARAAATQLEPFAALPIMPSLAVVCLGSVERPLGLAARAVGDDVGSIAHFERAVAANERLGNRPLVALCRAELSDVLATRAAGADRERAAQLLKRAIADGEQMGMTGWVTRWQEAASARTISVPIARESDPVHTLQRRGTGWTISYAGRDVALADRVGIGYIARLLAQPGVELTAMVLASGGIDVPAPAPQVVADDRARRAYREQAKVLATELAEARRSGDIGRVERLELEVDALAEALDEATGLLGRDRCFAGPDERARTAVRKAIKRAVAEIRALNAELGDHLEASITTGHRCCYAPATPTRWVIQA